MIIKYSVGNDIGYKDFRSCIVIIDDKQQIKVKASRKFDNSPSGYKDYKDWYTKNHKDKSVPMHFCMEATGVYHEELAYFIHGEGHRVSILLANHSKKYLESIGIKSKNDKIDAKGLAQMGAERALKQWDPPVEFYANLRNLTLLKNDDVFRKVSQICEIKGVAELTVAIVISETYGFELFENAKQLVSYAGYDVVENQSGQRQGKTKISKKGNSRLRRAMHLPAFNVKKHEPVFRNLYDRTFEKHKIKMKSYVAIQRKLLTTIYALWKNDEEFDTNYHKQMQEKYNDNKEKIVAPLKAELLLVQ